MKGMIALLLVLGGLSLCQWTFGVSWGLPKEEILLYIGIVLVALLVIWSVRKRSEYYIDNLHEGEEKIVKYRE